MVLLSFFFMFMLMAPTESRPSGQAGGSHSPIPATTKVSTGPAVGEKIPSFSTPDQQGVVRDFESIRGPKGAVIQFFRSADW